MMNIQANEGKKCPPGAKDSVHQSREKWGNRAAKNRLLNAARVQLVQVRFMHKVSLECDANILEIAKVLFTRNDLFSFKRTFTAYRMTQFSSCRQQEVVTSKESSFRRPEYDFIALQKGEQLEPSHAR